MRRWVILAGFWMMAASACLGLNIRDVRWGFDGQVKGERFTVLSVLVENPTAEPYEGALKLYRSQGMASRVGAEYALPCYISPFSSRWVQFYPYVTGQEFSPWRLVWGQGLDESRNIDQPKLGRGARVMLYDMEAVFIPSSGIKMCPDILFPPTVTALDGVDSIALDYVPRWESAKRETLLAWIRQGGILHVLQQEDGHYPLFPEGWEALNAPLERSRMGMGWVIRHPVRRRAAVETILTDRGTGPAWSEAETTPVQGGFGQGFADQCFLQLVTLSRAHHAWWLIHILAIGYVLAIGPGHFLYSRKLTDYRMRILLLLGLVAGFGLIFHFVGRHGQGEKGSVHTLSYARSLEDGTYDVNQWINVFAAKGDFYTISHEATHNLYSTGNEYESVNGLLQNGKDGKFAVDIPPYSSRTILHQARMKGDDLGIKVIDWQGDKELKGLTLAVAPSFVPQIRQAWLRYGERVYDVKLQGGHMDVTLAWAALPMFLNASQQPGGVYGQNNNQNMAQLNEEIEKKFASLVRPLLHWSLAEYARDEDKAALHSLPPDRAELWVFAKSPESFSVKDNRVGPETGYVVYQVGLLKPD